MTKVERDSLDAYFNKNSALRVGILSLSLSTLILLSTWDRILSLPIKYLKWNHLFQISLITFILTLIFIVLLNQSHKRTAIGRVCIVILVVFPLAWLPDMLGALNGITTAYLTFTSIVSHIGVSTMVARMFILGVLFFIAFIIMAQSIRKKTFRWVEMSLLILSPLAVLLYFQLLNNYYLKPLISPVNSSNQVKGKKRVLWLVFDELDQIILKEQLTSLPSFQALQAHSLSATTAHAPGSHTDVSVPSLWTGEPIFDASSSGRGGLLIKPSVEAPWSRDWIKKRNIFDKLYSMGYSIRIIGWYFPYCSIFPAKPRFETDDSSSYTTPGPHINILTWLATDNIIVNNIFYLYAKYNYTTLESFESFLQHQPKAHLFKHIHEVMVNQEHLLREAIVDPKITLIFGHIASPHLPLNGVSELGQIRSPENDYLANLKRCDQLLGACMNEMSIHKSNEYMIIVTSDHWFRYAEAIDTIHFGQLQRRRRPIPFIVFLSGATTSYPITYIRGFNTIRTRDLIESFLSNQVQNYEEVIQVLDNIPDTPTRLVQR